MIIAKVCSGEDSVNRHAGYFGDGTKDGTKDGVKSGVNGVNNGVDGNDAIIECIKEDAYITIGQMVAVTGIPRRTIDRILKQMKENGILEREGSSRSGYWILHL